MCKTKSNFQLYTNMAAPVYHFRSTSLQAVTTYFIGFMYTVILLRTLIIFNPRISPNGNMDCSYHQSNGISPSVHFYGDIKTDPFINFISRQTNTELYLNIREPIDYVNTPVECYGVDTFHILYYHIKYTRRLKSQPILLKNCLKLYLLLLAGDVATNPGPVTYPCGHCARPVA